MDPRACAKSPRPNAMRHVPQNNPCPAHSFGLFYKLLLLCLANEQGTPCSHLTEQEVGSEGLFTVLLLCCFLELWHHAQTEMHLYNCD